MYSPVTQEQANKMVSIQTGVQTKCAAVQSYRVQKKRIIIIIGRRYTHGVFTNKQLKDLLLVTPWHSGFGGLVVSMLASASRVRGF
jgi:hypothetical protein